MGNAFERIAVYYRKHGAYKTLQRFLSEPVRNTLLNKNQFFHVELADLKNEAGALPAELSIKAKRKADDIARDELVRLVELRGEETIRKTLADSFSKGALLWLLKSQTTLAAICWSVAGRPIQPQAVPMTMEEIHIFDVETFPEFRGQGLAPRLVNAVLEELANQQGYRRAYIDAKYGTSHAYPVIEQSSSLR